MTQVPKTGLQALVFGASGITGWAIANSALSYPTPGTFSRVVGLARRPLRLKDSGFPSDSRLELYTGLDLSHDLSTIVRHLKEIVRVEQITHVYFAAYIHRVRELIGLDERIKENVDFLIKAIAAVEKLCPNVQFWTLHTSSEIRSPFSSQQVDTLARLSEGKSWRFADIRSNTIVGFVPNHNRMNIAEPLALYLSLWKCLSDSHTIPFPGTAESYTHLQTNISSGQLGRFHIYASLHPESSAGKSLNIADSDEGLSWDVVWPGIAAYFGLEGVGPVEEAEVSGMKWVMSKKEKWDFWTRENGLRMKVLDNTSWDFMTAITAEHSTSDPPFGTRFDISEARRIGFKDSVDHLKGYHVAFDMMRAATIVPEGLDRLDE